MLERRAAALAVGLGLVLLLAAWLGAGPVASGSPPVAPAGLSTAHASVTRPAVSIVNYTSSIDGFQLSYQEYLPSGYDPRLAYPLAVELHGINPTENAPKAGGYNTSEDGRTIAAASAAGYLLIVPNTRTGDGYYTDSPYTGPQAQDILDAITHEESLRNVSRLYLFGFSMGGMGTLAIGLAHPGLFAGLGAIATESDIYELTSYGLSIRSGPDVNALLNTSGGYPNASSIAASVWQSLSMLRLQPEAAKGLRLYFTAGGSDLAIPNNPSVWPYLEANDSLLQTSCLYISGWNESPSCTTPLAAYAALDPANFSFRYVYEPNGVHDYSQLNATDLFAFFSGSVGPGLYTGLYPVPTPVAPRVPLVTLVTSPFSCGTVSVNGVPYPNGFTLSLPAGSYNVTATPCVGYATTSISTGGGVRYNAASATVAVGASGSVVARFTTTTPGPANATVEFLAPGSCPFGTLDGVTVSPNTARSLALGTYAIAAASCGTESFSRWVVAGGASVGAALSATTSLTVSGNGSVEPLYAPSLTEANVSVRVLPAGCGPLLVDGSQVGDGASLTMAPATVPLIAGSCSGYDFSDWIAEGGVATSGAGPSTQLVVSGSGSVAAVYTISTTLPFTVRFLVTPATCGAAILVDGVAYANGTRGLLPAGPHTLSGASCVGESFGAWTATGNVSASGVSLVVSGNGTLAVSYNPDLSRPAPGANNSSSGNGWLGSAWLWGPLGVAAGAALALSIARLRQRTRTG